MTIGLLLVLLFLVLTVVCYNLNQLLKAIVKLIDIIQNHIKTKR